MVGRLGANQGRKMRYDFTTAGSIFGEVGSLEKNLEMHRKAYGQMIPHYNRLDMGIGMVSF